MHFVIAGNKDPNNQDTWSGIPANFIRSLRRCGHEVTTIGPFPAEPVRARIKGWAYRRLLGKHYVLGRDPAVVRARAPEADALLRRQAADAVITLHPTDAAYLRHQIPLILIHDTTWHQLMDFYPRYERHDLAPETIRGGYLLDRSAYANADHLIVSSRWCADSLAHDYGVAEAKLSVQHFGANLASDPSRDDVRTWIASRGRGPCRLLFVGVDWRRKGGDIALAIGRCLRERGVPVELQLVGGDPPGEVPDFVRSFGFLSKKDAGAVGTLHKLFVAADFVLLPSRADCSPVVLSEAAAYGLPVATTAVGGVAEIVGDGSWGTALPLEAGPETYARWLEAAFVDRASYGRMAQAARLAYEEHLNWSAFCRRLVDVVAALGRPAEAGWAATSSGRRAVGV